MNFLKTMARNRTFIEQSYERMNWKLVAKEN